MEHDDIRIEFEYGRTWALADLPPRSIALDGAVSGPAIDAAGRRYSFDHHGGCVRHATRACCEQVWDALRVGLDPRGFTVWVNDVDADSALGAWLLLHAAVVVAEPPGGPVEALTREIGRLDALGPAAGPGGPIARLLEPPAHEPQTTETLRAALELLDRWARGEPLPEPPPPETCDALWVADGKVRRAEVEDGFRGLYARAKFGVLIAPAPGGTWAYSVGKTSEFVPFDVTRFLATCAAREPGWGGGSTIGGAPRRAGGLRSNLPVEAIESILLEVAARPAV